jgi:hypothetical protein
MEYIMRYTKTVFIRGDNQYNQFKSLKIGQWITGLSLNNVSGYYWGQFMGFDNDNQPIINLRLDHVKSPLDWRAQFKSNKALREFARIKC